MLKVAPFHGTKHLFSSALLFGLQLRRDGIVGTFFLPHDGENPPALAVKIKLIDVDAACLDFAGGQEFSFVTAKDGCHVPESVYDMRQFMFGEAALDGPRVGLIGELLFVDGPRGDRAGFGVRVKATNVALGSIRDLSRPHCLATPTPPEMDS